MTSLRQLAPSPSELLLLNVHCVSKKGTHRFFVITLFLKVITKNRWVPFLRHPVDRSVLRVHLFRRTKPLAFFAYLELLVNFVHTLLKHYSGYFCRLTVNSQPDGAAKKLFSLKVAILHYSEIGRAHV